MSTLRELLVDPISMETKKGIYQTQQNNSFSQNDESSEVENYLKHAHPQTRPADHLGRSLQLNKSFNEESNSIQQVRSHNEYRIVQSCDNFNNVVPSPHYVQYQKSFQNPHYHAHQAALVPNIPHNLVVQNSPQVWIPQQHHYRLPQAQNAEYKNVSISSAQTTPSKPKDSEKKKVSGISQLKSPIAKRPLEAPVAMQGWLHKQGSEGLMLWKKRWFVLSEYCLFYYKGPEEEKLLGSILLPSYKVSLCKPEERVSKKYAFKCEHLNMRTYILAADSQELMKQWVHNLSLAATMQTNVDVHKPSNYNAAAQQKSVERYEPSCQQQYHKTVMRLTPISHTHSPSSSVLQDQGSFNQPLYANAPPKPRRLNDGFSSPSPDILDPHNPHYVDPRTLDKSPVPTYSTVNYKSKNPRESLLMLGGELQGNHDFERRTPDTYGRSKLNNPHLTDYEDVYAAQPDIYKRPLSPVAYSHVIKRNNPVPINPAHRYYTPVEAMGPTDLVQYSVPQMRRVPNINTARPHSADFLEYELNHKVQDSSVLIKQRPRPKSSLEINSNLNDNDNYFYSKERYAEKMRKSAQYLQNTPPKFRNDLVCNSNETPMRCSAHDTTFPFIERPHVHSHVPNVNKLHINNIQKPQPVRRKSVLSEGNPFNTSMDMDSRLLIEREQVSPYYLYGNNIRSQDYDSFTRSASARLAQTPTELDRISVDNRSTDREGEKKREESMKRLLEWKQRMLQSPLNRKIQGNVAYRGKTGFYDNNNYDNGYKVRRNPKRNNVYRDEMLNKTSSQYNSYSSDDEENEKQSEEIIQSQAGETLDTERTTPPISTSTTTLITSTDLSKPKCHPKLSQTDNVFETSSGCAYIPEKTSAKKFVEKTDSIQSECYKTQDDLFLTSDIINNNETEEVAQEELKKKETEEQAQEENYIPMSPSKNLLSPRTSYNSGSDVFVDKSKVDENPYVEMTQNATGCFLDSSLSTDHSEHQPYELISFSGNRIEPLYMELKSPGKTLKREELPDVLVSPQKDVSNKSDSSDADDEASKDLDSLDTPSQPRFSLSDTFRPASYYLGTTQTNTELQDSSDSELVSPPPIPSSPLSLEDLNSGEYVKLKVKDEESADTSSEIISSFLKHSPSIISEPKTASPVIKNQDSCSKYTDGDSDEDQVHRATLINRMRLQSQSSAMSPVNSVESQHLSTDFKDEISVSSNQLDFHDYENLIISRCDESVTLKQPGKINDDSYSFSKLELPQVGHQVSSTYNSVEINSFLQNSNRSTPISETISLCTPNAFSSSSAPYYYSDLSISLTDSHLHLLTLNNKRNTMTCHKRDISHIKNPIKGNFREVSAVDTFKLAAEARSVSVDFLNLTDKTGHIDDKNIYESDTIQRNKSEQNFAKTRNLLASRKSNKFVASDAISYEAKVRRSHSLEGLLEHVLKDGILANNVSEQAEDTNKTQENGSEGSYLWEEDSIWRERLRSASQRHTKSMEDLDCIDEVQKKIKSPRGITRSVTYVNEGFLKIDKQKELDNIHVKNSDIKAKQEGNFILDREKLRQWDLMSSAPSDNQAITATTGQVQEGNNIVVDISDATCDSAEITDDQKTASGSISINMRDSSQLALRDSFLRVMSAKKSWATNSLPMESRSVTNLSRNIEKDQYSTSTPKTYYSHQSTSHPNLTPVGRQDNWRANDRVSVSAGELLGRTHEELVLLLIQLRRQNAQTLQAIENYYNEVDRIQAQLCVMDQARRMENLQKLEQIRQHLLELEKQYEKGKPLVNLVDNMVKLGSLYRTPQDKSMVMPQIRDRLEFNQQIQERRLLADQKREWNRLNSNHHQFQEKVQQLYILDRLIHEESGTLQKLQQDKEDIERALGGLRHRLSKGFNDPSEIEIARKQQVILENDLSRVYFMLAQNSKKLEETVSGNAKLEQELMVLKQKLQNSRQGSPQYSNAGDSLTCTIGSNIGVESDLQKVEKKIGELQKQRQKLSLQVRQLTNRSPNASQQKSASSSFQNSLNKKKIPSLWRETDLDTMSSIDHGECDQIMKASPMYINTDSKLEDYDYYSHVDSSNTSISENNSVIPQEKQEIKTVRIVKRESEKRQRDREKLIPGKWDVVQEDDGVNNIQKGHVSNVEHLDTEPNNSTHDLASSSNISDQEPEKSSDMLPVFKSEAARQIITEMSVQTPLKQPNRRAVPKEKRRHYTAPHNHSIKSLNPPDDVFDKLNVNNRRARDDLDMERALRQRIDAPDVVRSTLINTELKYNERTIDDLLGIPSKINIPERYIPEQLPQLTVEEQEHRMKKVETIKKMLSDTTFISTSSTNLSGENRETKSTPSSSIGNKANTQIMDEKKQREHLLQLNQILAKQVMEMSKIVAVNATVTKSSAEKMNVEEEDLSPLTPLPLYQQRDNFYS
ncbi:uncharacterized protein kmr isoform X2 [Diabrotica undecimpunctata]|uniref:uncharacterized protein kmr isoform X2 n=1 Tax=Diabrotica undecimpunctata TaxID=50387 RepID=UPI003B63C345